MDKEELAEYILSKIISKHLSFVVNFTENNEDGSFTISRTERAEAIYKDILKLLEENENKS